MLKNKWYDILKWVSTLGLPAVGTLYMGLADIWGFPKPDEINSSIILLCTFLGVVLGLSSILYNKSDAKYDGLMTIRENELGDAELATVFKDEDPTSIAQNKELKFKVNNALPGNDG